ncbi:MAG: OadG family protein [Lentisphaeria bacterium]|nr:OadG family protein [Lentisphaeria bacterium]
MAALLNGMLLTVIGMGTVFLFLGILVACTTASSRVCGRFAHLLPEKQVPRRKKERAAAPATRPPAGDGTLAAVVSAAVHAYRRDHAP